MGILQRAALFVNLISALLEFHILKKILHLCLKIQLIEIQYKGNF